MHKNYLRFGILLMLLALKFTLSSYSCPCSTASGLCNPHAYKFECGSLDALCANDLTGQYVGFYKWAIQSGWQYYIHIESNSFCQDIEISAAKNTDLANNGTLVASQWDGGGTYYTLAVYSPYQQGWRTYYQFAGQNAPGDNTVCNSPSIGMESSNSTQVQ